MSVTALGWAYRHSPLTGASFAVHLALADVANEQNDHLVWMNHRTLAAKARVSRGSVVRAFQDMEDRGLLLLVQDRHAKGLPNVYQFLMPADAEVVYEPSTLRAQRTRSSPDLVTPANKACAQVEQDLARSARNGKHKQELQDSTSTPPAAQNVDGQDEEEKIRQVANGLADYAYELAVKRGTRVYNPVGFRRACRSSWEHIAEAAVRQHPQDSVETIVARETEPPQSKPTPRPNEDCPWCEGNGWRETDSLDAVMPCECRSVPAA